MIRILKKVHLPKQKLSNILIDDFYDSNIQYSHSSFHDMLKNELVDAFPGYDTNKKFIELTGIDSKADFILKSSPVTPSTTMNLEIDYYLLMEGIKEVEQLGHLQTNILPAIKIIGKFLLTFDTAFFSFSTLSEELLEIVFINWLEKNGYAPYVFSKNSKRNVISTLILKKMIRFFRKKYVNQREKLRWKLEKLPSSEYEYSLFHQRFIINCHYLKNIDPTLCYKVLLDREDLIGPLRLADTQRWNLKFQCENIYIQIEIKYLLVRSILSSEWSFSHGATACSILNRVQVFMNEVFPKANSLLDISKDELTNAWKKWLENKGYSTQQYNQTYSDGTTTTVSSVLLRSIGSYRNTLERFYFSSHHAPKDIFDRNVWSVKELASKYELEINMATVSIHYLDFEKLSSSYHKTIIKRYLKEKILSRSIYLTTSFSYLQKLKFFCNFMALKYSDWNDFRKIDCAVIQQYCSYFYSQKKSKDINRLLNEHLQVIRIFLSDLQLFGWGNDAPIKDMNLVLSIDDFPRSKKYTPQNNKFIPLDILKQFFQYLPDLSKESQIIILIMYFCGLRLSDVLNLKIDCITQVNGNYFIKYDNMKSKSKNNFIPLTDENLIASIKSLIAHQSESVILMKNKKNFVFWEYSERAKRYRQINKAKITRDIRLLTYRYNIKDKEGELYFISPHQFRHTFGNHLLEGGIDIMTIRHWMGHRSIYPTFVYTKNSQENLREQYDQACQKGVFSVIDSALLSDKLKFQSLIKSDATIVPIRTYYGTCLACDSDDCKLSAAPPCLRINEGAPCKDLGIGFSQYDKEKYDHLIKDYSVNIQYIEENKLEDNRLQELKSGLEKVSYIRDLLEQGYCIYGRKDRFLNG